MTGLAAIVDRELRQTVRRRAIYRFRSLGVGGGLLLSLAILMSHWTSGNPGGMGRDMLTGMVLLSFGFSLLVGPVFAADSISEEKREGTLGLLMLTPLRGYEVVAGKLFASFMPCLQILLAVVPVFSLGFFIGGVAYDEMGRALLLLSMTLTLSLSVALATSCFVRRAISTMTMSFVILLTLVVVIPLVRHNPGAGGIADGGVSWLSPTHALLLIPSLRYATAPAEFWRTIGMLFLLSSGFFLSAGMAVTRSWKDRSQPHRRRIGIWNQPLGYPGRMTANVRRVQLLDDDPLLWLSTRFQQGLRWTWLVVALIIVIWAWCLAVWPDQMLGPVNILLSVYLANGALKFWVAWHASHRLAEDRRSGALEMLLCLPIDEQRIWRSWLLQMKQRLFWPFAGVLFAEGALVVAGMVSYRLLWNDILLSVTAYGVMAVFLVGDSYTLSWAAMSRSLSSRSSAAATAKTLLIVLVLPSILVIPWAGMTGSGASGLGGTAVLALVWGAMGLGINLVVCGDAVATLTEGFRSSVVSSWGHPPDLKAAWKSLSATKRRHPPDVSGWLQRAREGTSSPQASWPG